MDNSSHLDRFNVEIGTASTDDAQAVFALQERNLGRNLSEVEQQQYGFVSLETPPELLKEVIQENGITVARSLGKIVGYVIPLTVEEAKQLPLLNPFLSRFKKITYGGKPLNEYTFCVIGQICVDRNFRRRGVSEKLYAAFGTRLSAKYELAVTELAERNVASSRTHEKSNLHVVDRYPSEDGEVWLVEVLDLRRFRGTQESM